MKKKTFNLLTGIIGGLSTVAIALVTYFDPAYATAINASIGIADTAVIEILNLFTKKD